jgi:SAM-dependent methyltransferase
MTEKILIDKGKVLYGIPLDNVVGAVAKEKGVKILSTDIGSSLKKIEEKSFDCVLILDLLQFHPRPVSLLRQTEKHLKKGGRIIVVVPNYWHVRSLKYILFHVILSKRNFSLKTIFREIAISELSAKRLKIYFDQIGFNKVKIITHPDAKKMKRRHLTNAFLDRLLSDKIIAIGTK